MRDYNDETIMPFGAEKGRKLANVSPHLLLWYYDNIPNLHEGFKKYIDENRSILEMEVLAQKQKQKAQRFLERK